MDALLNKTGRFIKRRSSTILTFVGVAGVIATAVMSAKAAPKANILIEQAKKKKGEKLTKAEVFKTAAPAYIPTVIVASSTIACVIGANVLNQKQQAGLMSAYAFLDSSYKEYKEKVEELYGEGVNKHIVDEIANVRYEENPISVTVGKNLYYDEFSARFFEATNEDLLRAEIYINHILNEGGGVYLNDFYEGLGIKLTEYGDYVGWSYSRMLDYFGVSWINFNTRKRELEDGRECICIWFDVEPVYDFDEY